MTPREPPRIKALEAKAPEVKAMSVHLLTATGAVLAMLALLAAVAGEWPAMFGWLLLAFVVDGVDGPLARKLDVRAHAPRFDGALLDLVVDYLTYAFVPAYALWASGLLPGWTGWVAMITVTLSSALYFADTDMKTDDASFSGFPGCWNMVVLVLLAVEPPPAATLVLLAALATAMFLPWRFVHPVRTRRWRPLTLAVACAWTGLAGLSVAAGLDPSPPVVWGLVAASAYLSLAGLAQQALSAGFSRKGSAG